MKRIISLSATVLAALSLFTACGQSATSLEISFDYTKQAGPGSNQFAVWIENEDSEVVKTLFVTHFSALGRSRNGEPAERGYKYRPSCVHNWVKNVNADALTDEQMDSFTGATPSESGLQSFVWDFTDQAGNPVPKGTYKAIIEADLHDWTLKTFTVEFSKGQKPGVVEYVEDYSQPDEKYEGMVTNVKFELK